MGFSQCYLSTFLRHSPIHQPVTQYLGNLEPVYRQSRVMCCDSELVVPSAGTSNYSFLRDVDICNDQNVSQPTVKRCRLSLHYTIDSVSQTNSALKENILVNLPMSNGDQIVDQFFYPQSVTVGEAVEVRGRVSPPGQLGDLVCVIPTRHDLQDFRLRPRR